MLTWEAPELDTLLTVTSQPKPNLDFALARPASLKMETGPKRVPAGWAGPWAGPQGALRFREAEFKAHPQP